MSRRSRDTGRATNLAVRNEERRARAWHRGCNRVPSTMHHPFSSSRLSITSILLALVAGGVLATACVEPDAPAALPPDVTAPAAASASTSDAVLFDAAPLTGDQGGDSSLTLSCSFQKCFASCHDERADCCPEGPGGRPVCSCNGCG
ncbi:MAG TPA: hypothetical protein VFP84_00780 [Kofleriaceae bacterium]|nr:hypothetical protein [Kofleriaceae bacterium]